MEVPAAPVVITDYFVFAHIESKQLAVRKAVGGEWVAGQDAFTASFPRGILLQARGRYLPVKIKVNQRMVRNSYRTIP